MFEPMNVSSFPGSASVDGYSVLCFSHLRWNFVYQRPQHLMSRFARDHRVLFIEEPVFEGESEGELTLERTEEGVTVVVPKLPKGTSEGEVDDRVRELIAGLVDSSEIRNYVCWYYTPMMIPWSRELSPDVTVYDCMDELSAFKNAPIELRNREAALFKSADLVFTGGRSLYEAKRKQHGSVHCFPSSIDVAHFEKALDMSKEVEPDDQRNIAHPRIGFFGVIDERTDIELLAEIAAGRPDWQFILLGPVVKISEDDLPRSSNLHYLGSKAYARLPEYIAGWDVAMMPFALNESTRFISPTKTPEYLAAGKPVVSTPIRDVVRPYGDLGLVRIASTTDEFIDAIESSLNEDRSARRTKAEEFLKTMSWDKTYREMSELIREAIEDEKSSSRRVRSAAAV